MSSNIIVNDNIYIEGTEVAHWRHEIKPDNLINGRPVGYFWNLDGGIFDGNLFGQVILAFCTNVTVENIVFNNSLGEITLGFSSNCTLNNNSFSSGDFGLFQSSNNTVSNNTNLGFLVLHVSSYNEVVNNTISGTSDTGFNIRLSSNNTVVNNTITGFHYGLSVGPLAYNNTLSSNAISETLECGIYVGNSERNELVNNLISGNIANGVQIGPRARYNVIYLNQFLQNGGVHAQDDGNWNRWNIVGIGNEWSDYSGIGPYYIPGSAGSIDYHPNGYVDTAQPEIDHPDDMEIDEGTIGQNIIWSPIETNPSRYVVYQNNTEVESGNWNGGDIVISLDELNPGVYNYSIMVFDLYANWVSDSVIVTVIAAIPTTTTSTPTTIVSTTTTPTTTPTVDDGEPLGLIVILVAEIGIAIVLVVFLLNQKRG
jgi:parallel beta-helix repeat protein